MRIFCLPVLKKKLVMLKAQIGMLQPKRMAFVPLSFALVLTFTFSINPGGYSKAFY